MYSSSNNLSKFVKLQPLQYFRLLTSGKLHCQDKGWLGYEQRERGAIPALFDAFSYMLDHLELPEGLTVPYLIQLHKIVQSGVRNKKFKATPGEVRYLIVTRPLFASSTSLQHVEEIFTSRAGDQTTVFRSKKFNPNSDLSNATGVMDFLKTSEEVLYQHWYPNLSDDELGALEQEFGFERYYEVKTQVQMQFIDRASLLIDAFNALMLNALGYEERLYHIAKLIRELSLLHLFQDGNTRLLCGVLLNQLLIKYGFLPACLFNQNAVSDVCLADWVAEIKHGMQSTEALLQDSAASLYGFSINELKRTHIEQMRCLVLPIAAKVKFMVSDSVATVGDRLNNIERMSESMVLSCVEMFESRKKIAGSSNQSVDVLFSQDYHEVTSLYSTYEYFCGTLVFHFFNQLAQSLHQDFGLINVDENIRATQQANLVLTYEACCAWCYSLDNHPPKAKVNFGSFFDFGDDEFLLHIALGTYHWNIGLVKFKKLPDLPYQLVRRDYDAYLSVMNFVSKMALGKNMDYRYWGLGWASIDMGRLDNFNKLSIIQLLLNPSQSKAYQTLLMPLITGLCSRK